MKYLVVLMAILTVFSVISIENLFAEEEISILVENDVRKVYYIGENITSVFSDPISASITFETGNNAKLDVKVPQIYKYGGQLFILRDGEEVRPDIKTDNCFYYVSFETQVPEKIELIFTHWPEDTELIDNCETFKILSPLKQFKSGIVAENVKCKEGLKLLIRTNNDSPACVKPETKQKLIERGWTENGSSKISEPRSIQSSDVGLQVDVTGQQQVRRGITHDITVDVARNGNPISDALVIITIEDYGKDVIRKFEGRTDDYGRFVFSWEIPKSFDDIETLLAYVDVTDNISAKTVLFKFQVYCLPGESGCKVEGN